MMGIESHHIRIIILMQKNAQVVDFNRPRGDTERKKINFELSKNRTLYVIATSKNN